MRHCILMLLLAALIGCDPDPIEDKVLLESITPRVEVDSHCIEGCGPGGTLAVSLRFDPDIFAGMDERLELLQYRIDYTLPDVKPELPFYAGLIQSSVTPDVAATLSFPTAGQAQREVVHTAVGDAEVDGTATLSLAGYDHEDRTVVLERDFSIRFLPLPDGGDAGGDQ